MKRDKYKTIQPAINHMTKTMASGVPTEDVAEKLIAGMFSRFDVSIETSSGTPLFVFQGIPAKTKAQAINKASQMLVFTAERA